MQTLTGTKNNALWPQKNSLLLPNSLIAKGRNFLYPILGNDQQSFV